MGRVGGSPPAGRAATPPPPPAAGALPVVPHGVRGHYARRGIPVHGSMSWVSGCGAVSPLMRRCKRTSGTSLGSPDWGMRRSRETGFGPLRGLDGGPGAGALRSHTHGAPAGAVGAPGPGPGAGRVGGRAHGDLHPWYR